MNLILKILMHCLPVVLLAQERWTMSLVLSLLVALPYIKTKKLTLQYEEEKRRSPGGPGIEATKKARRFWQSFTFIWLLEKL